MADVSKRKLKFPAFMLRVRDAISSELVRIGIPNARVTVEPITGTKLHRITVVAAGMRKLRHSERQDLVWRIIDEALPKDRQLFIASVYVFTPTELSGDPAA